MNKAIFSILFLLLIAGVSSAQGVRVGPFLAYGDGFGLWGIGAYSEIVIDERISISPVFTQYFPEDLGNIPRRSAWEVSVSLNYYVITGEVGYLYGFAGPSFTHIKTRTPALPSGELVDKDGNIGLNLGIGTMVKVSDLLLPFVEAKYTVGGYSQFTALFGVKFQLGEID